MKHKQFKDSGFAHVGVALLILLLVVVGGTGAYVYRRDHDKKAVVAISSSSSRTAQTNNSPLTSPKSTPASKPKPAPNPYDGWKTFTSSSEGFTVKYPPTWKLNPLTGYDSYGSTDFDAPDGLIVRYVELLTGSSEMNGCGHGAACFTQHVLSVTPLAVPNYGTLSIVKTAPDIATPCYSMYLDKPSSAATTPTVGDDNFQDYTLNYSLPSKIGGRFSFWLTNSRAGTTTFKCGTMTQTQFFNLQSVEQAELILKSITYKA